VVVTGLIAIAPPLPSGGSGTAFEASVAAPFRTHTDDETYALDFDPRRVRIDLLQGWDREQQAFADRSALAFISGPMYERQLDEGGRELTVPLGDLKLGDRIWRGRNRSAARQRAFVGIRHDGRVEFGFGELTAQRARDYETFIGGLHSLYNDLERPPAEYRGAYSISMGQQIRYLLPRIRVVFGLRPDGRMEVLMSRDGLTLEQTRGLARQRGLRAAYLPDHASKSRFIIPGVKGFDASDANWISGGATSFAHVPYLLRLSERSAPLRGGPLAEIAGIAPVGCGGLPGCGPSLGSQLLDRAMAGFNRLIEKGVEPIARLIWAPKLPADPARADRRPPLREAPISADPMALRRRQEQDTQPAPGEQPEPAPEEAPLPMDLPEPVVMPEGQAPPEENQPAATAVEPEPTRAPAPPLLPPPPVPVTPAPPVPPVPPTP
jgi:hypothetical protein